MDDVNIYATLKKKYSAEINDIIKSIQQAWELSFKDAEKWVQDEISVDYNKTFCFDYINNPTFDIEMGSKFSSSSIDDINMQKILNITCRKYGIKRIYNLKNIKKNSKYDKYLVSYPDLNDDNFEQIIYNKKEFNYHKQPDIFYKKYEDYCKPHKKLILLPHQRFLKNFISTETPYNGALIFHGTGSGKTCTSISIAEGFVDLMKKNENIEQKKIMVIYPGTSIQTNFIETIYDINKEKKEKSLDLRPGTLQCTGDKYYIDREDISYEDKEKYYKKKRENNYEIIGKQEFTNLVNNMKDTISKKYARSQYNVIESQIEEVISNYFSNRLIIIDEIHNMKQTDIKDEKRPIDALKLIIEYAKNLKLIFMSATPMFDKPTEIVDIINLLLLNDKRPLLDYKDIFDYKDGKVKNILDKGYGKLQGSVRGYVSYLRGENPISYPQKYEPDSSELKGYYKNNIMFMPKTKYDIDGEKLDNDNRIIYTNLIKCEMSNYQFKFYNYYYYILDKKDVAHKIGQELCNIVYPIDKNENSKYGTIGFQNAFNKLKERISYEYKNFNQGFLKEENLAKYSTKYYNILQNIKKSPGIAFIYFDYIEIGVITMCMILEEAGYEPYKGKPFLHTKVINKICSVCNKYKTDPCHTESHKNFHSFKQAKFLYLTDHHYNINERQNLIKETKTEENAKGEVIKIILGTSVLKEGVDLFNIRQIHLGDIWHNMSKIRQIIGRGARFCSHKFLSEEERNLTIFRYCTTMPSKCSKKDELICRRETVNEKMWKDAEMKDIVIKKVERLLKESSIDCMLNKNINLFDKRFKEHSDKDFSAECDYMKCDYKCISSNKTKSNIDSTTMVESFIKEDIELIMDKIIELFNNKYYYKLNEIISILNKKNNLDIKLIFIALTQLIGKRDDKYPVIFENFENVKGFIIYRSNYYVFQPLNMWQKDIPISYRKFAKRNTQLGVKIEIQKQDLEKKHLIENKKIPSINDIISNISSIKDKYELSYHIDHFLTTEKKVFLVESILKKYIETDFKNELLDPQELLIIEYANKYIFQEKIKNKFTIGHKLENIPKCYNNGTFTECELDIIRNIDLSFDTSRNDADIIGYLEEKNNNIKFKIIDNTEKRSKVRHDSKVAKNTLPTGKVCETYDKQSLDKFCKILNIDIDKASRSEFCMILEIRFRKYEDTEVDNKKWFYTVDDWKDKIKMDINKDRKITMRKRNRRTKSNYKMKYKFDIKKLKGKTNK